VSEPQTETDKARVTKDYSTRLALIDRVFSKVYQEVIAWLELPQRVNVLDAGCGAGGMTLLFANAVSGAGRVTALDITANHLETTKAILEKANFINRVQLEQGSVDQLPFENEMFDAVWCSHVVHGQPDPLHTLRELARVLRPGGRLALREDVATGRLLPLEPPGLEEHIRAFYAQDQARWRELLPNVVKREGGWPLLLKQAGFANFRVRTFTLDFVHPLTEDEHAYLAEVLAAWHEDSKTFELSATDKEGLERYASLDSTAYLLKRSDLHVVSCLTVYVGSKE
jgi:ubiquinone/menaquinone biosynthesis C-methylase UbiE